MRCTPEILKTLTEEIESIPYGTITITLNEKGKYVEISSERKKRIFKDGVEDDYHKG